MLGEHFERERDLDRPTGRQREAKKESERERERFNKTDCYGKLYINGVVLKLF